MERMSKMTVEEVIRDTAEKAYACYVYDIVKRETYGIEAIYGDYIETLIGIHGLIALRTQNLVETCGVVNGRQLYTLRDHMEC